MKRFKVFYQDNSGLKCEEFDCEIIEFRKKWLVLYKRDGEIVIAIPTEMIYSVEEITSDILLAQEITK